VTTPNDSDQFVVDSSGWLEHITADTKAEIFAPYFNAQVLVPVIVLYEVRKILLLRHSKALADAFVSLALRHSVINIDEEIALHAADLGLQYQLPMGDALLYASALAREAQFITSDTHFSSLPGVTLI